jgi:hypothetical protein
MNRSWRLAAHDAVEKEHQFRSFERVQDLDAGLRERNELAGVFAAFAEPAQNLEARAVIAAAGIAAPDDAQARRAGGGCGEIAGCGVSFNPGPT